MPALPGHADARPLRGITRHALVAFSINLTVGAGMIGLRGRVQALVGNYRIGGHRRLRIVDRAHRTVLRRGRESLRSLGGPQLYASVAMGQDSRSGRRALDSVCMYRELSLS
jgi:hypothetical protein